MCCETFSRQIAPSLSASVLLADEASREVFSDLAADPGHLRDLPRGCEVGRALQCDRAPRPGTS